MSPATRPSCCPTTAASSIWRIGRRHSTPRFGRLGQLKQTVADAVAPPARAAGLRVDVSTDPRDAVLGDRWFPFIASARAVLGSESGASAIDRRGELVAAERTMLAEQPDLDLRRLRRRDARRLGRSSCPARSGRDTWKPPPPGRARCSSRVATTASWSRRCITSRCGRTARTPAQSSNAWPITSWSRPPRREPMPTSCSAAATATPLWPRSSSGCSRRSGRPGGARSAGSLRRAQAAAAVYNVAVVRPPRWAYKAVDRVAPGVIRRLERERVRWYRRGPLRRRP